MPKSQLAPTQLLIHIGVEYWLDVGLMFPPMDRVHKIESGVSLLLSASDDSALLAVPPWAYELGNGCHPLGETASQTPAALLGHSLVPIIEGYGGTDTSETQLTRSPSSLVVEQELHASRNVAGHSGGSDAVVYRRVGVWGAHSDTFQASGEWSAREAILHINQLEMLAVRNALTAFKTQLSGLTVQLMSDSTTVVSYIAKQGGTTSIPMYLLAKEVLLAARDANIFLRVKHIPGERNTLAVLLSRMNRVVHTEWTLLQSVVDALGITWDTPNVDLFATRLNNRFAVFVSSMADPLAVEVDAMSISWKGMYAYAYAFPPFVMLGE